MNNKLLVEVELELISATWTVYVAAESEMIEVCCELALWDTNSANEDEDIRRFGEVMEFVESALPDGLPEQHTFHFKNNNQRARMNGALDVQIEGILKKYDPVPIPTDWEPTREICDLADEYSGWAAGEIYADLTNDD